MAVSLHMALAVLLSGAIGISLGLLGGGGSILAVPVLVYVAGIAPQKAIAMSLAIVGTTSLLAGLLHRRSGHVDRRVVALFGLTGSIGAFFGAKLTHLLPERTLLLLFAGMMLVVGAWMLAGTTERLARRDSAVAAQARPGLVLTLLAGAGVGALTGFLGIGGGFLIVPALVLLTRLPMKHAVGTSLIVIALNSASGFVSHLGDAPIDVVQTAVFTAVAIVGATAGHRMACRLCPSRVRRNFAGFVMLVACFVAVRALVVIG
jgi:hypothetical protein